jgi:hypothetical protein
MEAIDLAQYDLEAPIERHFFNNAPPDSILNAPALLHQCIQLIEEIVQIRRRLTVLAQSSSNPTRGSFPFSARLRSIAMSLCRRRCAGLSAHELS